MTTNQDFGLNDKSIRDFGEGVPFLPWGAGRYRALLTSVQLVNGANGNAWSIKLLILESNREDVRPEDERAMWLPLAPADKAMISLKRLRGILAAAKNANPSDPAFDANTVAAEFRALGDDLASRGIVIDITASDKTTKKGTTVTNYHFKGVSA